MIRDIRIENYRLFRDFVLEPCARVNLVVGTNNSGKSSLLEAIYLLTNEDVPSSLLAVLDERGELVPRSLDYRQGIGIAKEYAGDYQIAHMFYGHQLAAGQSLRICSDRDVFQSLTCTLESASESSQQALYVREGRQAIGTELSTKSLVLERAGLGAKEIRHSLDVSEDGFIGFWRSLRHGAAFPGDKIRFITSSHFGYQDLAGLWDKITLTPREERVIEALQILEPAVQRISFTSRIASNSGILLKLEGEREPVPLGSMGDGTRRVLAIVASLVSVDDGILLVDEIDTGLYYRVLTDVWRLILATAVKRNAQVFATTHSWDCVRSLKEALDETEYRNEAALIRLERRGESIRPVLYSKDELDIAIEQGIEVR